MLSTRPRWTRTAHLDRSARCSTGCLCLLAPAACMVVRTSCLYGCSRWLLICSPRERAAVQEMQFLPIRYHILFHLGHRAFPEAFLHPTVATNFCRSRNNSCVFLALVAQYLHYLDYASTIIFTFEAFIKIVALGFVLHPTVSAVFVSVRVGVLISMFVVEYLSGLPWSFLWRISRVLFFLSAAMRIPMRLRWHVHFYLTEDDFFPSLSFAIAFSASALLNNAVCVCVS